MLTGNNGIGKTTLIKLILDLFKLTEGCIDRPRNCVFSYLPDSNGIYDYLTVMQNIKFRLGIYNIRFDERAERTGQLLQLRLR